MADPTQEPSSQGAISGRNGPSSSALAGSCVGPVLGSQTTAGHQGAVRKHDSSLRVSPNLTSLTSFHILRHLPVEGFVCQFCSPCVVMGTSYSLGVCSRPSTLVARSRENNHSSSECHPMVSGESRDVWVQLLKTVNGLADGTRECRKCFFATARGLGFVTSILEPCVLVLRSPQQTWYHWSGRRRHCWWWRRSLGTGNLLPEETFHFWALESGKKEILQSRGRACSRWIHARWTANLCQESGLCAPRATEERTIGRCNFAMRLVLGALGYSARESRPDLSRLVATNPLGTGVGAPSYCRVCRSLATTACDESCCTCPNRRLRSPWSYS